MSIIILTIIYLLTVWQVFIHRGRVHIIPKPRSPAELTSLPVSTPSVSEAVRIVSNEAIPTEAGEPVQKCIQERLNKFVLFLHVAIEYYFGVEFLLWCKYRSVQCGCTSQNWSFSVAIFLDFHQILDHFYILPTVMSLSQWLM